MFFSKTSVSPSMCEGPLREKEDGGGERGKEMKRKKEDKEEREKKKRERREGERGGGRKRVKAWSSR